MYLHINKNCVIKNNSVIGMFTIDNIEHSEEFKNLCNNIKGNILDLSDGNPKTFLLVEEKGETKGYILKLNVDTIKKRSMV